MTDPAASFSFLALGDSYTLGEGVDPFDAWPFQLRRLLRARELDLEPPVLIARTGWTTGDLAEAIEGALTQNFEKDYRDLLGRVETALTQQQLGDFTIETRLDTVSTGAIKAYGEGLHLPASASGTAQIRYAPR